MPVFKRPSGTKAPRQDRVTRAAAGDVIAKLEMISEEFDEIAMQVDDFDEEEKADLKRTFSEVNDDIGEALCQREVDVFEDRLNELNI